MLGAVKSSQAGFALVPNYAIVARMQSKAGKIMPYERFVCNVRRSSAQPGLPMEQSGER